MYYNKKFLNQVIKVKPLWISLRSYLRGGADKSLARPTSQCRRMESIVLLE